MTPLNTQEIKARIRTGLTGAVALVLIGLVFYLGARTERSGFVREVLDPGFRRTIAPVLNAFRGAPPPVTRLMIRLDTAAWDSLNVRSARAFRDRRVTSAGNNGLAAQAVVDEHGTNVAIALREGPSLGGRQRNWPLNVHTQGNDTILGMRNFDIVPVNGPGPLWSMVLHALLADQGQPALEGAVADVELNGDDLGLCALLARADVDVSERGSHGLGPILRFEDDLLLNANASTAQRALPGMPPPQSDWLAAPLLFRSSGGSVPNSRSRSAIQRMEAFRAGTLRASEVFVARDLARTMALCDLLGTTSALDWWNLRFLVDSTSERLIPIPLHVIQHGAISELLGESRAQTRAGMAGGRALVDRALNDPVIEGAYIAYLDSFSAPGWLEQALERTRPNWEPQRKAVNAEFPHVDMDMQVVQHDRLLIRQALEPHDLVLPYVSDTLVATDGVAIANVHSLPVEVIGVVLSTGDTSKLFSPLRLEARLRDMPLHYAFVPLYVPGEPREVLVRLGPAQRARAVRIRTWSSFGAN